MARRGVQPPAPPWCGLREGPFCPGKGLALSPWPVRFGLLAWQMQVCMQAALHDILLEHDMLSVQAVEPHAAAVDDSLGGAEAEAPQADTLAAPAAY